MSWEQKYDQLYEASKDKNSLPLVLCDMLNDMESHFLHVVLVPQKRFTNHGGMIRVCASRNAPWYQNFCANYSSSRRRKHSKHDTAIRRASTIAALKKLIALCEPADTREKLEMKLDAKSVYPYRLLAAAEKLRVNPPKAIKSSTLTHALWGQIKHTFGENPF